MNAIPSARVTIASPAEPRAKLHSIRIMIDLNLPLASTSFAFLRNYVTIPVTPAKFLIHIETLFANRMFPMSSAWIIIEIIPFKKILTFTTYAPPLRKIVFPKPPAHRLTCHFIDTSSH